MAKGLLLAMMEPPSVHDAEFNDWYDNEHLPERLAVDGFLNARRFVCVDGWPRYLALYDLASVDVLHSPGYYAIARDRYSPWTHRTQAFVQGLLRAEGTQLDPGDALFGDAGGAARLVLWHFRDVPAAAVAHIGPGLRAIYGGRPETAQLRVFKLSHDDTVGYAGLVELRMPRGFDGIDLSPLREAARAIAAVNVYVPYRPRGRVPGLKT
jgi:hypothetical protein